MKMKRKMTIGALALAMAATSYARTWTSADGKNSFEADFISAEGEFVTVNKSGKKMKFSISKLAAEDQEWIKEELERQEAAAAAKERSDKLKDSKVPKALAKKLVRLDSEGKKYEDFDLAEAGIPQYFLVYYSASW